MSTDVISVTTHGVNREQNGHQRHVRSTRQQRVGSYEQNRNHHPVLTRFRYISASADAAAAAAAVTAVTVAVAAIDIIILNLNINII